MDERKLAVELFNRAWKLMEQSARTPAEDDELLHCAHASRYHWIAAGTAINAARGEWQCSRVYTVLGRAEPALHHARRCLELVRQADDAEDWDEPFAHEALARAHAVARDAEAPRDRLGARGRREDRGRRGPRARARRSRDDPALAAMARFQTTITPVLTVRDAARAVDFYKRAFGATEVSRHTNAAGQIVADLEIDGARFRVVDEAPSAFNVSPETLNGTSVRLNLLVADPDAVAGQAVAAGATEVFPIADQAYGLRQGRVADPFGHHWLIGRPLDWP
jgi:uncharacterized glyoxalase superfamily protein PhnB